MAPPNSRRKFKEYIMRRLGFPVTEINVDDQQVEDRIDDALSYYQEYHFDGSEQCFYKHQITADDIANKFITVPVEIMGITKLVDGMGLGIHAGSSLFDVTYQMMLNDFFNLTQESIVPYYLAMRHINMFSELFNATPGIRFNRKTDKLYVDTNWSKYQAGNYMVFDCYKYINPEDHPEVWQDKWLLRYGTALVKRQWGENLKKHDGITILGGRTLNGQKIWDEAVQEIKDLEDEMIHSFSLPVTDMFGPGL